MSKVRLASNNDIDVARAVYFKTGESDYQTSVQITALARGYAVSAVYGIVNRVANDYVALGSLIEEQLDQHKSESWIAERVNLSISALRSIMKRYYLYCDREQRFNESMRTPVPEGHLIKGVSTLQREDGSIVHRWIKTDRVKQDWLDTIHGALDHVNRVKPLDPVSKKYTGIGELLTLYPVADLHLGIRAATQRYDLQDAYDMYYRAFSEIIDQSPSSYSAVVANLGDFTHLDNLAGITPSNRHILESSDSYSQIVNMAMDLALQIINLVVNKHDEVKVIWKAGNHDEATGIVMGAAIRRLYEKNPQVQVIDSNSWATYYRHGANLLGFAHGHTVKMNNLPLVMATDKAESWGNTSNRVWHIGHTHHKQIQEFPGCTIEVHRSPAPRDTWHEDGGYRSQNGVQSITYDANHEISRVSVNL